MPVSGWLLMLVAFTLLAWRLDLRRDIGRPRLFRARHERAMLLGIVLLTAAARFVWLGDRPPM